MLGVGEVYILLRRVATYRTFKSVRLAVRGGLKQGDHAHKGTPFALQKPIALDTSYSETGLRIAVAS